MLLRKSSCSSVNRMFTCASCERLHTKHRFCDDVALDLVRSAVDAELARVEIFFRRGMPVVRPRHEHVIACRMLAQRKAIIADRAVREIGDALENLGASDLK